MATDRPKAFKDLVEAAEHGDPRAQFELGRRHYRGEGAPLDRVAAERWFKRSAQGGHAVARIYLAELRGRSAQPGPRDNGFERWLDNALVSIKAGEEKRRAAARDRKVQQAPSDSLDTMRRVLGSRVLPAALLAGMVGYLVLRIFQTGGI